MKTGHFTQVSHLVNKRQAETLPSYKMSGSFLPLLEPPQSTKEKDGDFTSYHNLQPREPSTANRHIKAIFLAKFVPVLSTMCMLDLKFLGLSCAFL